MSCFVGGFTREYDTVTANDLNDTLLYTTTGNGLTMMSNRLSWFYDLRGESLTLDTACSSSLVALSLACQSIRNSKSGSRQSLVAGSNLILVPDQMTTMNPLHFLSPDSQCFSFDDRANGYVRGEGIGVLMLKHIDDAIRDGDCIRAVIRNVVCNQDGKTPGITLPSSEAQVTLMRKAYDSAHLSTDVTGYFEAHGTGTAAGDPLEVSAIASVFDRAKPGCRPLLIGSVKPNIGHLEAAAGMAGLIKTILALESGVIPPNINFENPNPTLGLADRNLKVVTEPTPWPTSGLRRASVNSFGYGGTNAHCVIDDAYHYLATRGIFGKSRTKPSPAGMIANGTSSENSSQAPLNGSKPNIGRLLLFVISAPEQSALERIAASQAAYLRNLMASEPETVDQVLKELAFTYSNRRSVYQWRTSIVSENSRNLTISLEQVNKGIRSRKELRVLFCFTGQGAQWYAMGRELLFYEVFATSVSDADRYLLSIGSQWSVLKELTASEKSSNINSPRFAQPLCTVLQIALVDLLRHWGVMPSSVIGHSSGEIAAAYALGALSAEDCWKVAFHRGRLVEEMGSLHPALNGGMLAVGLGQAETKAYIEKLSLSEKQTLSIACVNSLESVTVSGDKVLIDQLEEVLKVEKIFARKLAVENAYHSKHMELIAVQYKQSLQDIKIQSGHEKVSMFSSVTGSRIKPEELGADYWAATGARRRSSKASAIDIVLEIGPHAALAGPIRQSLQQLNMADKVTYASMLRRKECSHRAAITAMGMLWAAGIKVIVENVNSFSRVPQQQIPLIDLPKYPWNHEASYWHESALSKSLRFRHAPRTDLLGEPVREFTMLDPGWKNYIRLSELPWISHHSVRGNDVFPAAGMVCAAIEGAKQIADPTKPIKRFELADVVISRALIIPVSDPGIEVFTRLKPQRHGPKGATSWYEFTFTSLDASTGQERKYTEHCSGLVRTIYEDGSETTMKEDKAAVQRDQEEYHRAYKTCEQNVTAEKHYEATAKMGIVYGPSFQGIKTIKAGHNQATFTVELQDTQATMPANFEYPFVIHPTLLDAAIQSAYQGLTHDRTSEVGDAVVPTEFRKLSISANIPSTAGTELVGFVNSIWISPKDCAATIKLGSKHWSETMLELENCIFTGLGDSTTDMSHDPSVVDRRLASKNLWKPAIDLLDLAGEHAQRILGKDVESPESLSLAEAACTQASTIFIQRALRSLTPEIEASLTGHWIPYLEWLRGKYKAALDGTLPYQDDAKEDWLNMTYDREEEFLEECRQLYPADINLLYAVGTKLAEIIDGSQPPLPVMLVDDMLTKVYADAHGMASGLGIFKQWFDLMGHKKPDMKILEVGAGTGSVTLPVLEILVSRDNRTPRVSSYTFTDISSGWFERAQELFEPWAGPLKYQKLDIEQDPLTQGFEPESFDVIAASNVLHATKRLDITLANCYKLLKPGGKIIIGELTWCPTQVGLIFGTLPGWWLSEDGRTGGPVIGQEEWDRHLRKCQFTGLDMAIAAQDTRGAKMLSVMVSTKFVHPNYPSLQKVVIIEPLIQSEVGTAILAGVEAAFESEAIETTTVSISEAGFLADANQLNKDNVATVCLVEAVTPVFARPTLEVFENVRKVITKSNALYWCACNNAPDGTAPPEACAISGLLRTARSEFPRLRLHEIHLHDRRVDEAHVCGGLIQRTVQTTWAAQDHYVHENEISERGGILAIPRIVDDEPLNKMLRNIGKPPKLQEQLILGRGRPVKLQMSKNNKVEGLHFTEDKEVVLPLLEDFVEVEVKANGINAIDVEVASARTPGLHIGYDISGIISKVGSHVHRLRIGDRVALTRQNSFRSHVHVPEYVPQVIPSNISLEQAAAIPFTYVAAYHGIFELGRVSKGEKVLITQAAGGLGNALITLSQHAGAEVYVTAASAEKRKYLEHQFNITPDHIFDSSSPSLMRAVKRQTNGEGFDIISNTLGGEQLLALCSCIAPFGRFLNWNQDDVKANASVQLRCLGQNISFSCVDMPKLLEKAPQRASRILAQIFSLLQSKAIKLIEPTVFDYSNLQEAFAAAQDRKHIGKIVLRLRETSRGLGVPYDSHPLEIRPDVTYAISGGLGGVGRAVACYLADHGARHIALLSRSTTVRGLAVETIKYLKDLNVDVQVIPCDVTIKEAVQKALDTINSNMPPVKGVIHGAMQLNDGLYENMTYEQWTSATKPKIEGTWNMHDVMPKDLDFFIMLSSIAGICGNPGQSNYSSGNSYQDAMSHYRRSLGLRACTIDVGGVGSFGWLEENKDGSTFVEVVKHLMINPDEFFIIFKSAATGYTSFDNPCPTQLITGIGTGGMSAVHVAAGGKNDYFWLMMQGRFAYLKQLDAQSTSMQLPDSGGGQFKTKLAAATSTSEGAIIVQGALVAKLAKYVMTAAEDIDTNLPVSSYGVDSLVAAELRNWCVAEIEAEVSVFEFLNAIPISTLAYQIAEKSTLLPVMVERN
ncbi:polyketide synthase [Talaromyces proteolyticus]|uniref:Polyketide synthase n=1 Tax=Talaromyces proteolyticus TaxID=1131652 RepID=A0AAD4PWS6_9EURO|nr:polyketide synthase [Talaromyces proteolyticus]KAH8692262.1 polyketide synthase [Talaromyces proteolyticus]